MKSINLLTILLCAAAIWAVTANHGIGFSNDSFGYLEYSEILATEGVLSDTPRYTVAPPLYPMLLAIMGNHLVIIRWLQIAVAGLNAWLFMALLRLAQVQSRRLIVGITLAVFISPTILYYNGSVLTEAIFLLLLQLAVIAAAKGKWRWALLFCALAPLQRFIGVIVIFACAALLWRRHGLKQAVLFGGLAGTPVALWMLRNVLFAESDSRAFGWHPVSSQHLMQFWQFASYWVMPLLMVGLVVLVINRRLPSQNGGLPGVVKVALIFIPAYLVFLIAHISVLDFAVPMNGRLLQPVLLMGWLIVAWGIGQQTVKRHYRTLVSGLLVFVFGVYGVVNVMTVTSMHITGVGMIELVRDGHEELAERVPENVLIYSNRADIIKLLRYSGVDIGAQSSGLPRRINTITDELNPNYEQDTARIIQQIRNGEAVLFWWGVDNWLYDLPAFTDALPYRQFDTLLLVSVEFAQSEIVSIP